MRASHAATASTCVVVSNGLPSLMRHHFINLLVLYSERHCDVSRSLQGRSQKIAAAEGLTAAAVTYGATVAARSPGDVDVGTVGVNDCSSANLFRRP